MWETRLTFRNSKTQAYDICCEEGTIEDGKVIMSCEVKPLNLHFSVFFNYLNLEVVKSKQLVAALKSLKIIDIKIVIKTTELDDKDQKLFKKFCKSIVFEDEKMD